MTRPDPVFWHRALDRRTGVVIPFPVRPQARIPETRLPPHKAFCVLGSLVVGMWLLILVVFRCLVSL